MGPNRSGKRRRSNITFKDTAAQAMRDFLGKNYRSWRTGLPQPETMPKGTKLSRHGQTELERIAGMAPEDVKSLPERLVFGWLIIHKIPFLYQESLLGGRAPGGLVVDFTLFMYYPPIAIRVMGYYHADKQQIYKDDVQAQALMDLGFIIEDVWEHEVSTVEDLNFRMTDILYGIRVPLIRGGVDTWPRWRRR